MLFLQVGSNPFAGDGGFVAKDIQSVACRAAGQG
jgi:hypothetical protein